MEATQVLDLVNRRGEGGDAGTAGKSGEGVEGDDAVPRSTGGARPDELARLLAETRRRRLLLEATVGALKAERAGRPAGAR